MNIEKWESALDEANAEITRLRAGVRELLDDWPWDDERRTERKLRALASGDGVEKMIAEGNERLRDNARRYQR